MALGCQTNDLFKCMMSDFAGAAGGEPTFGVLVGGTTLVAFWVASPRQSLATPAALLILLGSLLIPMLPGGLQEMAWSMIIVGLAGGLIAVAQRYVLNPGVR